MNIREISDIFKDTADNITAIKSYNFGWASDRVRQGNTEDFQELNEFPRVFFAVPTITGSDQTRKQDTYQVTIFFDDLLGYDNEGDEDPTLQIDKWANLQQYANYFVQRLNKIKQSILPNYLFIPEAPSITFDSFTGLQRMITVQLSFNLVVPTNCDPGVIAVVQCIANIVTSSKLTASLTTVLKFAASLEGTATVTADINFVQKVASSLNANASLLSNLQLAKNVESSIAASSLLNSDLKIAKNIESSLNANGTLISDLKIAKNAEALLNANASLSGDINFVQKVASSLNASSLLSGDISFVKNAEANLSSLASLSGDINFVQKAQASLLATANVTGNITIPKTFNASLLATGTTTADLTVGAAASLLLDLYPNAAAAYSLRKLRTAYSGSAIRVRRSSDNTEQDIGFTGNDLNTTALTTFVGAGNGFVTTWYDQSGNANNASQTTQASQPQIVISGSIIIVNNKAGISFTNTNTHHLNIANSIFTYTGNSTLFHVSRNRNNAGSQYGGIIAQGSSLSGQSLAVQWQQFPNTQTRATTDVFAPGGVITINTQNVNTQYLATFKWENWSTHKTNGNTIIAINGVNQALAAYGTNPFNLVLNPIYIGAFANSSSSPACFLGDIQELVVYTTAFLQTNIDGAETNINTHYAIY